MTILVFGQTGQVARELARQAPEAVFLGRNSADLADPSACAKAIHTARPSAVINAAAWTAVDAAEIDRDAAFAVNAASPGAMAQACADLTVPFVHISTDYVFDGSGETAWTPSDATGPLGVYGASKLAGETSIADTDGAWGILRTSWVFSAYGANFVKTMIRLSETRDALNVVDDQIGGPTPAADIAAACIAMATALGNESGKRGIYHFSGAPDVSWADFAREIFRQAGREVTVSDIPSSAYPTPAPRPLNSRLDCSTTKAVFGINRPDWRAGLSAVLAQLAIEGQT